MDNYALYKLMSFLLVSDSVQEALRDPKSKQEPPAVEEDLQLAT